MTTPVIIGDATLYLGDCLEILPMIGRVDAVVTDPPYGIAYRSGHATDHLWGNQREIINDLDVSVRNEALLAIEKTAAIVFGSHRSPLPPGHRMTLIWDKGPALGMGALDLPWKPSFEEIYVIGEGFQGKRNEGAVLVCAPVQSMAKNGRLHPNQKPVTLLYRLVERCPDGTVCDPFMGSGTTGVACMMLGRKFIGIEIDQRYFDIACRRIDEAQRQGRLFDPPRQQYVQDSLL